jgi:hypothetical protein
VGRRGIYGRGMDDKQIMAHIDELIDTEHQLRRQLAAGELTALLRGQWSNGMVPHIVFNPSVAEDAYFPGPSFWQSSTRSPHAPRDVETSGITNNRACLSAGKRGLRSSASYPPA